MTTKTKRTLHPLMFAAGIALTLFCAAGIAAIMGWIPNSTARSSDRAELAVSADQRLADKPVAAAEKPHHSAPAAKAYAAPVHVASNAKVVCQNCGIIEAVRVIETRGEGSGVGAVGGAV